MVSFVGYNLIRNDRLHKGRGGVAIYLRGDFEYSIAAMSNGNVEGSMEYIFLEIRINNSKLLLGVVYRPPRRSFVEFLTEYENILADFVPVYSNILIQGDFNCNLLNDTSESSSFHSLIDTLCLEVLPTGATFHLPSGYSSLLDLSMTSSSNKIKLHGSLSTPGFTNHDLLYVVYDLRCSKSRNLLITYRDYKHLNLEELLRTLSEVNWDVKIYQVQSVNDKVTSFCEIISELYDKFVPVKQSRVKRRPAPWLTDELKRKMNARDRAHAQYRRTKSPLDWEKYRKLRNGCTHACRDARRGHIVEYISEGSPDNIWPLLKGMGVGPDQHSSDNSSNSVDLNGLNSHFTTNPAQVNGDVKTRTLQQIQSLPKPDCPSFDFRDVTSSEVSTALSAIKSNATGNDGVCLRFIKLFLSSILPVLTHIYNESLSSHVFPDMWKYSLVTPIPKVKTPSSTNDYRPISILPVLSKVFERLVYAQINAFLTTNCLLNPLQSGFRAGHSTSSALLKVTDDMRRAMDKKMLTILLLLDFSKAFDSVDHDILLARLVSMNLSGDVVEWFRSYLSGRKQCVKGKDGELSDWLDCTSGVPQGSVLGPLLFSLFINSITSGIRSNCHLYADDLQLYVHFLEGDFVSAVRLLNDDLEYIRIWTGAHGILPNPNKFQAIVVGSEKRLPRVDLTTGQLSFNGTTIPYSNNVKNLGVIIDSTLSWESHINNVTKKCFFSFHSLNLLRRILPFNVRKLVCSTLILPIIEYADNVYIGMTKELQTKVQRLQNTCVRYIFGLRKYDHVSMCRASLGWLTMDQRREIHVSTLLWRVLNTRTPSYLASMFTPLALHAHDTRSGDEALLMIPVHRTEFFARSFSVQAAKLWNSLPRKLRTCDNQKVFRRLILEHYTD
ncbi:hypothetical protein M8J77_016710 [Diaphorina citri]|nr:hypothetical protein M8J77_016710 [Diaphorina citri]